ncbi:uncharacterized protein SAMN02745127_00362 [Oceanospirillum multiglobuliferum]|uniref:YecA family protein n=2 Tax=Oceanospirillum TaxID=965 RepID=A0A1T4L9C8_9GAMM|nr:YecA family protein [Oceanospirillum multiglobuliferum]OPX56752.1 hypothetical protein BTE48_02390 [Oceanospirillum multiglobuliferum]SJZ51107.1 uncharacterized protein SAMN02745127_00362 [Oceanospirillum multiglobuliferum]
MTEESIPVPVIAEDALDQLYTYLESDLVDPEALDIIGLHGFMIALAICPEEVPTQEWLPVVFNGIPKFDESLSEQQVITWLEAMLAETRTALYRGQTIELPFEPMIDEEEPLDDSDVSAWCAGFMEAVMLREETWFSDNEQEVAELLLPFMAISCLFPDEELDDLVSDLDTVNRLAEQLQELLVDLYLLFHAPAEKPAPFSKTATAKKGNRRSGKRR